MDGLDVDPGDPAVDTVENVPLPEPPPQEPPPPAAAPTVPPSQQEKSPEKKFALGAAASFLFNAHATGTLGSGPTEPNPADFSMFLSLLYTLPRIMLLVQLVWSGTVLGIAYTLGNNKWGTNNSNQKFEVPTLGTDFWSSKLNVSSSVSYGVGWALFVLLGFFIREASARYREGQTTLEYVGTYLRQTVRNLRQNYAPGTWHDGDIDRIVAHLVAYPVALKMSLRGEREREQLETILHPDDVTDVLAADSMHFHCSKVVRAYFSASEDDAHYAFPHATCKATPAGWGVRYFVIDLVDAVDMSANSAVRISEFRPAVAYVNHLRIFLYIWIFFLPLAVVKSSGWFTPLFTVLITYGVGMLFKIAHALNEPYGFDLQDVKLNRLCSKMAYDVLIDYTSANIELKQVIRAEHNTPRWLEEKLQRSLKPKFVSKSHNFSLSGLKELISGLRAPRINRPVLIALFVFFLWTSFVVFGSWRLTRNDGEHDGRWWSLYIPVTTGTTGYVSLGIFLLLGFWMNDAYGRYWQGLQIWQTRVRTYLEEVVFQFAIMVRNGAWHPRDRERLFSHMAALPYLAKSHLRGSKDLSDLHGFLAEEDIASIAEAPDLPAHAFNVIYGYLNSVDKNDADTFNGKNPFRTTIYTLLYSLWTLENAITECHTMRKFPMSPSFTQHLQVFTFIWLALLPLTLVNHDGFLSFLYLVPIGYSIINLLSIGRAMADPFGYDEDDIPLDMLCDEMKDSIHKMYQETLNGAAFFIVDRGYKREWFVPKPRYAVPLHPTIAAKVDAEADDSGEVDVDPEQGRSEKPRRHKAKLGIKDDSEIDPHDVTPTIKGSLVKFFNNFPHVSVMAMVAATLWTVIAVVVSWALGKDWDRNLGCEFWCSPIDVKSDVLANIGFALFMILAFRASDAIGRYEEGAMLIYDMEMNLRSVAITFCMAIKDGWFHNGDKERLVAHLAQVPLCFRDLLLDIERETPAEKEGLLTDEDRKIFEESASPVEHLLQTIEAYLLINDSSTREGMDLPPNSIPPSILGEMIMRISSVRRVIARALGVKRFPVIGSYTKHQHMFTALWVILLPLSMTSDTGWYTILWAPLISYGVFGLESIASKLVDPYGHDNIDIPVDSLCSDAANSILEAVHSAQWGLQTIVKESPVDTEARVGTVVDGKEVKQQYTLARIIDEDEDVDPAAFLGPRAPRTKPALYAHFLKSVPWGVLLGTAMWAAVACIISYLARKELEPQSRVLWWESKFTVSGSVATYVSFAAFTLLGFYVQAAFSRYNAAGAVWGDSLRTSCHSLTSLYLSMFVEGAVHKGDHKRIVGFIAAVPLVLKQELRGSRDLREVQGLLSYEDLCRMQYSKSMISHIVLVLRAYYVEAMLNRGKMKKPSRYVRSTNTFVRYEVEALQDTARSSTYLREFQIAPGFIILLNALLGLWFVLLPFVLAETSGWFTILWVPIIAYGLLGMYSIADELAFPFGTDLNDLDLDTIADKITADVLFVAKSQQRGWRVLLHETETPKQWNETSINDGKPRRSLYGDLNQSTYDKMKESVMLASEAVPIWINIAVAVWTSAIITFAWGMGKVFFPEDVVCSSLWFCSPIAISGNVKEYIGFALFLLLGFRLYDSHWRYVQALKIWQDGVIGYTRLLANRIFESYDENTFHKNDLERISGHLAAFSICVMGGLRKMDYADKLSEILCDDDVQRVLAAPERVDYCVDVIRAYITEGEAIEDKDQESGAKIHTCGCNEHWALLYYLRQLTKTALECQRMVRIPLPFGYVQHLRVFLAIWIVLLPLGLVESTGWVSILWIQFIAYGVIGIERWAEQLSDPFGFDVSDVPLDELCDRVIAVVKTNLDAFRRGLGSVIVSDRDGFSVKQENS